MTMPAVYQPSPASIGGPLLGRDAMLDVWCSVLTEAGAGSSALVEIRGDPGIGKTRLLQEFGRKARAGGATVLSFGTTPDSRRVPSDSLPSLAEIGAEADRSGSVALLLDDLHLSDPDSLRALSRIVRAPRQRLAVAVSYRPRQAGADMVALLNTTAARVRREVMHLSGLSPDDLCRLLRAAPGSTVNDVYDLTQGNPLHALAYQIMVDSGKCPLAEELASELPSEVSRILDAELALLSPNERVLADAAAVLGDSFDPALAAVVAGIDTMTSAELVDRLVARDLLRADPIDEPNVHFRSSVVRAAIYRSIRPSRRRRMHAATAMLMRNMDRAPSLYADHVARSAVPGDLNSARLLVRSATSAATSPPKAAAWLATARRLLPARVPPEFRYKVNVSLTEALTVVGRLDDARVVADEIARIPAPCAEQRVRAALARAFVDRLAGRAQHATDTLASELAHVPAVVDDTLRLRLVTEAAVSAAMCGAPEAVAYAERSECLGYEYAVDSPLAVRVAAGAAFVYAYAGLADRATAALERATAMLKQLPRDVCTEQLDAWNLIGWAEIARERDVDAIAHFEHAIRLTDQLTYSPLVPYLHTGLACAAGRLGRLDLAADAAARADDRAAELGMESLRRLATTLRVGIAIWRGAEPPVSLPPDDGPAAPSGDGIQCLAERLAAVLRPESDAPPDRLVALEQICGGADLAAVEPCVRPFWAATLAGIAEEAGDRAGAARWAEQADRSAIELRLPGQRAHAMLAMSRYSDRPAPLDAAALAGAAARTFADLEWMPDEAAARLAHARALSAAGFRRDAESEIAAVRRIAESAGLTPTRRAAATEWRRLGTRTGRPPADPSVSGPAALTPREWDIVLLVTRGVSNAVIAERLYVTVKTVEAHLTRIFRKLGVSSRVGLVVALSGQPRG